MKKILRGLLFGALLGLSGVAHAQSDSEPVSAIEESEHVLSDDASESLLYLRANDWATNHFTKLPKTSFKSNPSTHEVRITGTGKVTPVSNSGKDQPTILYFDFVFHTTPKGYDYRIANLRVVTNPTQPSETMPLEDFITQLGAERTDARTNNKRRVTAQATSLASEVALSFRS
ncbi:MAG TPA: DUF4468 domain-containing protein, partial [Hymenobacter sp.]